MHSKASREWWATIAEDDVEAEKAVELCRTIQLTLSTRDTAVIVGPGVTEEMRSNLEIRFDWVVNLNDDAFGMNTNGLKLSTRIKLFLTLWKLMPGKKVVFVRASSLILKNCDELFEVGTAFAALCTSNQKGKMEFNASVVVLEPSAWTFRSIMTHLMELKPALELTPDQLLNSYFGRTNKWNSTVKPHYNFNVASMGTGINMFNFNTKIVTFSNGLDDSEWISCHADQLKNFTKLYLPAVCPWSSSCGERFDERDELKKLAGSIAIVGLSCRFPGANNEDEFWEVLSEGRDETKTLPAERYFTQNNLDETNAAMKTPVGYLKCPIDEFDAKFFHISRREAECMDPQQRILLEVCWESLENAGVNPQDLEGTSTAVYVGIWAQEYSRYFMNSDITDFQFKYLGNALCASSARISHFLGVRGASITMEAGCASALEAFHFACESLREEKCNLAISAGVNIALNMSTDMGSLDSFLISKDGKCKTFDESADGFARGENCVSFILKRLTDAVRDGNKILGVVRGSALNSDGMGSALGTPNAEAQELVIREALNNANLNPDDISYLEAHGTGTPAGDPIEFHGINNVFASKTGPRARPLIVGSVKTNIGHTEGSSGMAGLVKVLLSMKNRTIPKHLHLNNLNPYIDLSKIPAVIPLENTKWEPCNENGLVAGVSSFGLSGTNVHVILQEPPSNSTSNLYSARPERTNHILCISAKSEEALDDLKDRYISLIESDPSIHLPDLSHSVNVSRAHLRYRMAVIAEDTSMLLSRLQKGYNISGKVTGTVTNKIGFLFTGQGSQYVYMANELYKTHPYFRMAFDSCEKLLLDKYKLNLKSILSYEVELQDAKCLDNSLYSQPALFCIGYCLAELWKSFGIEPEFVLGHSVGEFAAAVVAGVLSLGDGLRLVMERSKLVDRLEKGSMMVVRTSHDIVRKRIEEFLQINTMKNPDKYWIDIAAINSDEETVVSGSTDSISLFESFCKSNNSNIVTQKLSSSHAFHSRAMDPILQDYQAIASAVGIGNYTNSTCRFISSVTAKEMDLSDFNSNYWVSHLRQPVQFKDSFEILKNEGCNVFVEIGPQPILLGLSMSLVSFETSALATWAPSIRRSESNWMTLLTSLGRMYTSGVEIDWAKFDSCYHRCRVSLPNYPFQREKYWHKENNKLESSLSVHSKQLHPIIGRRIPSPRSECITYHSSINLNCLPYVKDHKVVDTIILPAAGYLEAIFAAGCDVLCGGTSAQVTLAVENMNVLSALPFNEDQSIQLQTVLYPHSGEDGQISYDVSIYKQVVFDPSGSDGGKWKKLVSATFVPCVFIETSKILDIDLNHLKSSMRQRDSTDIENIYSKLKEMGINFGPLFKSVQGIWVSETQFLIETSLPADASSYVCHPIVLDCMIQSCVATLAIEEGSAKTDYLYLPMEIKSCICLPKLYTEKLYILINRATDVSIAGTADGSIVKMYNENGVELASMEGLDLVQTTQEAFMRSIRSAGFEEYPEFFDIVWKPALGPNAKRLGSQVALLHDDLFVTIRQMFNENPISLQMETTTQLYLNLMPWFENLCYLYILKALVHLGMPTRVDSIIFISKFAESSSVLPQHRKLLRRFFQILAEEGDVVFINSDNDEHADNGEFVKVIRMLPSIEDLEGRILEKIGKFNKDHHHVTEVDYIMNCGEPLIVLLQGKISPFTVLFPENKSVVGAEILYASSPPLKLLNDIGGVFVELYIKCIINKLKELDKPVDPVIRILEIGGGTGAATISIINGLDVAHVNYEYTFTDISPLFLKETSKLFYNNKNIKFKLLDIEQDPGSQGFPPNSYEFIIADLVLHATKDLHQTLNNVKYLQAPSSALMLMEFLRPIRHADISFGFLEGWWRFNDFRKDHPSLTEGEWKELLVSHGYQIEMSSSDERFTHFSSDTRSRNNYCGLIAASYEVATISDLTTIDSADSSNNVTNYWLLCGALNDELTIQMTAQFRKIRKSLLHLYNAGGDCFTCLSPTSFNLNPLESSHFSQFFHTLKSQNIMLDGVVYLWGISSYNMNVGGALNPSDTDKPLLNTYGGMLNFVQAMTSEGFNSNMYLITNKIQFLEPQSLGKGFGVENEESISRTPISATLWGIMMSLNNEFSNKKYSCIDIDLGDESAKNNQDKVKVEEVAKDIFAQLWLNEPEFQIMYRNSNKYIRRLVAAEPYTPSLALPYSDCYKLINPCSGLFSDFKISSDVRIAIGPKDVEVSVKAVGLNFKDVLIAMMNSNQSNNVFGSADAIPSSANDLGLDFSGIITNVGKDVAQEAEFKIGDRVCGFVAGGALSSHLVVSSRQLCQLPGNVSYESGSTICAVALTSVYFLKNLGKLHDSDKILIHVASGGVGLASIQYAQSVGAEIYATAGSSRKRNYLKSFCGIKYVYNSRNTDFGAQILEDTKGYGVDVVLNALTGPNFKETSLSICARNARFLEMSKINVWTEAEVTALRPDVYYHIMEINHECVENAIAENEQQHNNDESEKNAREFIVKQLSEFKPLPFTLFTLSRAHDAFKYLQEAKHIGKVVIKMPTTQFQDGVIVHKEELFNEYSCYLITGGLGGIGLEVTKWMINSGAKYLILVGRKPPSASVDAFLGNLRSNHPGLKLLILQGDVSDYNTCASILNSIKEPSLGFPPLKGIMHAAGVLQDNHINNQTIDSFMAVYKGKIVGVWNFHKLTKYDYQLDYFVLYSSFIAILGGLGQSNHCSANVYLDQFAKWRHEQGLPCTSINWGGWSDVGAAASLKSIETVFGIRRMSPAQGILSLERVMLSHKVNVSVTDISDWGILTGNFNQGNLFESVKVIRRSKVSSEELEARMQIIKDSTPEELYDKVREFVEYIVRDTLRLSEAEPIDPDQDLRELGIDSLMGMELRSKLQPLLADYDTRALSVSEFMESRTINAVSKLLTVTISRGATCKSLTEEERLELVQQDIILPDEISIDCNTTGCVALPSKIQTVLLTGANGHLGVYILRELNRRNIFTYCLIRGESEQVASERLEKTLEDLDLIDSINLSKIKCLHGNVVQDNLGLEQTLYDQLCTNVDGIIHCSIMSNYNLPYGKFGADDLRSNNVLGLLNVLRFATKGKIKYLHYPSALAALTRLNDDGSFPEEFPSPDDLGQIHKIGYTLSKFICEKLLRIALEERGLPINIIRHCHLFGDSETGLSPSSRNHSLMFIMTCEKIGLIPDQVQELAVVPVNTAAKITIDLFLNDSAPFGIYNLNNPKLGTLQDLKEYFEKKGVQLQTVHFDEWREAAIKAQLGDNYATANNYIKDAFASDNWAKQPLVASLMSNRICFRNSDKLKKIVPYVDEIMTDPIDLVETHVKAYEKLFGKENIKGLIESMTVKS